MRRSLTLLSVAFCCGLFVFVGEYTLESYLAQFVAVRSDWQVLRAWFGSPWLYYAFMGCWIVVSVEVGFAVANSTRPTFAALLDRRPRFAPWVDSLSHLYFAFGVLTLPFVCVKLFA